MSEFNRAAAVEMVVWQLRLAHYSRDKDQALIDATADGAPPYSEEDAEASSTEVNVNDLSLTRLCHDARQQIAQAFNTPGNFFVCQTDMGAPDRRSDRSAIVTAEANRLLKASDFYFETLRSKFAQLILHGKGPCIWNRPGDVLPTCVPLSDVMIPSRTRLTFDNLPFFAVWRGYTARELRRLTRYYNRDPGWNMPAVRAALKWCDEQTAQLFSQTGWQEYWVPTKRQERYKEDAGMYSSDIAPTIDCWDFYYWSDEGRHEGWRRRVIFDAQGGQSVWRGEKEMEAVPSKNLIGQEPDKAEFLYTSGSRPVADDLRNIIHFQFADLSAVAPHTYHRVRGLGWLLFAVCQLQSRLRCAFSEAVFEQLMNYMRVKGPDDVQRALKVRLVNRGILDDSVRFLQPSERWQPNAQLIELGLGEFKEIIRENSSAWASRGSDAGRGNVEKTKFQVMSEISTTQQLISTAIAQASRYQVSEYREDFRRLMRKDSRNAMALEFRARCLKRGIPEKMLVAEAWDLQPDSVYGGGNRMLQMAVANQLMEWKAQYPAESQRIILRDSTLAVTQDPAKANLLVPHEDGVSDSKTAAMQSFGTMMAGGEVQFTKRHSVIEVAQTLLTELALVVAQTKRAGNMPSMDKYLGMQNVVQQLSGLIVEVSQDKTQEKQAKVLAQLSGKLANEIKGFGQRIAQAMKARQQQGANGGAAAEMVKAKAKAQATVIDATVRAKVQEKSHAQRTADRIAQEELHTKQREAEHAQDLRFRAEEHAMDLQARQRELAMEERKNRLRSTQENE